MHLRSIIIILFFVLGCQSSEINIAEKKTKEQTTTQSGSKFDPYGYYLPKEDILVDGCSFEWLLIPGNSERPAIRLRRKKMEVFSDIKANSFSINEKMASFEFSDSKGDKILIKGQFLGKHGPLEDKVKNDEKVFQGTMTINDEQTPISMTWFEGD